MSESKVIIQGQLLTSTSEWPPTKDSIGTTEQFEALLDRFGGRITGAIVAQELVKDFTLLPNGGTANVAIAAWARDSAVAEGAATLSDYEDYRDGVLGQLGFQAELRRGGQV